MTTIEKKSIGEYVKRIDEISFLVSKNPKLSEKVKKSILHFSKKFEDIIKQEGQIKYFDNSKEIVVKPSKQKYGTKITKEHVEKFYEYRLGIINGIIMGLDKEVSDFILGFNSGITNIIKSNDFVNGAGEGYIKQEEISYQAI